MKRIAVITFHGAHNFGSNLQAYALQDYILQLVGEKNSIYEIINLRTKNQLDTYSIFKKNNSLKNGVKNILMVPYFKLYNVKYRKFEDFINNELNITREFKSEEELLKADLNYDYYISGSDQLWNVRSYDFDWSNYLSFVRMGKKISYAASFGPLNIQWDNYDENKTRKLLEDYDHVSVREEGSLKTLQSLSNREAEIHVDPTLLLTKEDWLKIATKNSRLPKKFILFYGLEPSKKVLEIVSSLSEILKMPVIITKFNNKYDYFNDFIKKYDTGPKEFLELVSEATFIISTSFHGTVFSILFNKPFFAIDGLKDNRIQTLLLNTGLEERNLDSKSWDNQNINAKNIYSLDFDKANDYIETERLRSKRYLEKALDI